VVYLCFHGSFTYSMVAEPGKDRAKMVPFCGKRRSLNYLMLGAGMLFNFFHMSAFSRHFFSSLR